MQTMVESPIYNRMKSAIVHLVDNKLATSYLLVPMMEMPIHLEEPDPVRGWRNREAGMVSIRNSHSWFGEVSVIQHDNVPRVMIEKWCDEERPDTAATFQNQKFRVAFLKPYKTQGLTSSEVALRMMRFIGLGLEADGFMLHHHYLDLGPARSPDRRVTLAYINMDTNHLVYVTANIIQAEWQDPNLAAFRVKGTRFKSIANITYPPVTEDRLDLLLNEQLGESALRSDDAFRAKMKDLKDRGWSVHAVGDDGTHYKMIMVDPNKDEAKILFHRMLK
jgi:hypothetical protein